MQSIPRAEYPRPQFVRPSWLNLNGVWQFEIDSGASGRKRGLVERELSGSILVPFCPESQLSTVHNVDFMAAVWYRRTFTLPREAAGQRVLLHFGAVDYKCEAWVNGRSVGVHEGGYASFTFEITNALKEGENTLVICADDDVRSGLQPSGKQSDRYESHDCHYTRTTGIWQTVWLEWVPVVYIKSVRMIPDVENGALSLDAQIDGAVSGYTLRAEASFEGAAQGAAEAKLDARHARFTLPLKEKHLWDLGQPNLYDLRLTLERDGQAVDGVDSYFGLRSIALDGKKFLLNGRSVFQRLILDQGFYPDGIYTAPTDEALRRDIELSMAMGFNGARLHQKVFEQRYLYWADKLGYLCWGEMASWGADPSRPRVADRFLLEWMEVLERDFNAPCIIGWCPYNETAGESNAGMRELTQQVIYRATKAIDPTRPVIDASGYLHVETDIFDAHDYEQDPEAFAATYPVGEPMHDRFAGRQTYDHSLPVFVSEYGGIRWTEDANGWGYGVGPKSREEFLDRYERLTMALINHPEHMGFCYTQLTDVEQEQNGLYTYERVAKFEPEIIAAINRRKAAIED